MLVNAINCRFALNKVGGTRYTVKVLADNYYVNDFETTLSE